MAFQNPNAPVIARYFATAPSGRRWVISSTPGNTIDGYSGNADETEPGHIVVDGNGTPPTVVAQVGLRPPKLASSLYNDNHLTLWNGTGVDAFFELHAPRVDFTDPDGGAGLSINVADRTIQAETSWTALPRINSWVTNGVQPSEYLKDAAGNVHIRGRVSSGVAAQIATLPVGYRPSRREEFALKSNNDAGTISWVIVESTGALTVIGGVAQAQVLLSLSMTYSTF